MTKTDINEVKLGGAKRKNGHKSNCTCHICENMMKKAKRGGYEEEAEKEEEKMAGGSKKKNGHRSNCNCPICKNMRNAKKGGADDDESSSSDEESVPQEGGKKKKGNGHKANCKCPICKNMRKGKSKKMRGGDEPDIENQKGDIEEAGVKGDMSANDNETKASDDEYDALDAAEKGEAGQNVVGGKRRTKKRHGGRTRKTRRARSRGRR